MFYHAFGSEAHLRTRNGIDGSPPITLVVPVGAISLHQFR